MQTENIRVSPIRIGVFLVAAIVAIAITSLTIQYVRLQGTYTVPGHLVRMFDLDGENSVPAWLSSVNLGACAVLLFVIARAKQTRREAHWRHFYGLAALFLFLSLDEAASIHEAAQRPVERMIGWSAVYVGWHLPAAIAVAALGIVYLRFFLAQNRRYQILFAIAGLMYVGGAIGFEMVSWAHHPGGNEVDLLYVVLNLVEEVLEMLGVTVFLISLMLYIRDLQLSICCTIED